MKLKYSFETVEMGNEYVSVPIGESANVLRGVIKLNHEGAEILDLLKTETTEEQIIDTIAAKYENDRETIARYVHQAIKVLRENDLIID